MTCGIAGSGKSTLAKTILRHHNDFTRLSADKYVHERHGLFGIDYPAERYADYLDEAAEHNKRELARLLREEPQQNVILDLSFWNKEYRNEYKTIVEAAEGRWVLVYLEASRDLLWSRIQKRREGRDKLQLDDTRRDGDSAYNIEPDVFEMYVGGFEPPAGEGEIVVKVE